MKSGAECGFKKREIKKIIIISAMAASIFTAAGVFSAPRGINIFTEVFRFPDRSQHTIRPETSDDGPPEASEQMRFMEKFMKLEEEKNRSLGGRVPLNEGAAKDAYEKDIMLIQSGILFDMRLGGSHNKKKEFLSIVSWMYDRKLPIMKKMQRSIVSKPSEFKKAEAEDFALHDALLSEVKLKFSGILNRSDYQKMFRQKIGVKGTETE